jgi:bacteriorhodopsin
MNDVLITFILANAVLILMLLIKSITTYEFTKYEQVRAAQLAFLGMGFMQYSLTFVVEVSNVLDTKFPDFAQKFRYISWIITTPLLLYTYFQLAKVNGYDGDFTILFFADMVMFLCIIASETIFKNGNITKILDIISIAAYGVIFWQIIEIKNFFDKKGYKSMSRLGLFFLISWPLYLVGVLANGTLKYLIYTLSDFINKFLYGLALNSVIDIDT